MSIIYEALKKTQQRLKINPTNPAKPEKKKNTTWLYLAFIIIGTVGCIAVVFLIAYTPRIKLPTTPTISSVSKNIPEEEITKDSIELPQSFTMPNLSKLSLQLKGIIYMDGSYIALINNKILKTGDFIEGAKIMGISDTRVDLQLKDRIFSLGIK